MFLSTSFPGQQLTVIAFLSSRTGSRLEWLGNHLLLLRTIPNLLVSLLVKASKELPRNPITRQTSSGVVMVQEANPLDSLSVRNILLLEVQMTLSSKRK